MLKNDILQKLMEDPTIVAVLNSQNGTVNVYMGAIPKIAPSPFIPAIVVQGGGTKYFYGADGINRFQMETVQFDSYAIDYTTSLKVSNTVRDLMKEFAGPLNSTIVSGSLIRRDIDMPFEPGPGGYVYRHMLAIDFQYTENN
jgi:hypothetical protein